MSTNPHADHAEATSELPLFLTQREVAESLRVPARTLEDWRQTRQGPPYFKLGRHVRYRRDEVLAWVEGRRHG